MSELRVYATAEEAAAGAAELLAERAAAGGHIAMAGGSTPAQAYRLAAEALRDWRGAVLWYGDDRCVPPDHEWSNSGMVEETLLSSLSPDHAPEEERVLGELGPERAAADYESRLRERLGSAPVLDLVLLGLGPDAHTASLFPGKPALDAGPGDLVVGVPEPGLEPIVPRVTMTLPLINAAAQVVFLVAGADKAEAVRRAFGSPPDLEAPAARVRPASGRLLVLCDEAAAARL